MNKTLWLALTALAVLTLACGGIAPSAPAPAVAPTVDPCQAALDYLVQTQAILNRDRNPDADEWLANPSYYQVLYDGMADDWSAIIPPPAYRQVHTTGLRSFQETAEALGHYQAGQYGAATADFQRAADDANLTADLLQAVPINCQ